MATDPTITVTIRNWKKYNPRGDVKESSWFRLSHSIVEDEDLYDFTHEEFKAWIYILSQASKKSSATVRINLVRAKSVSRIARRSMESAIKKLSFRGILAIDVTSTDAADTPTCPTYVRTDVRTNDTFREPPAAPPKVTDQGMADCLEELGKTLAWAGIQKDPKLDEWAVGELIKRYGAEKTRAAIAGAKFEAPMDKFDPKKNFSVERLKVKPAVFAKLENLGYPKRVEPKPTSTAAPHIPIESSLPSEELRRNFAGIFKSIGPSSGSGKPDDESSVNEQRKKLREQAAAMAKAGSA